MHAFTRLREQDFEAFRALPKVQYLGCCGLCDAVSRCNTVL